MRLKPKDIPGYEWRYMKTSKMWRKFKILDPEYAQ